VRYKNEFVHK